MRVTNRILTALLGLGLFVLGLVVVVELVGIAVNRSPVLLPLESWYRSLTSTRVRDGSYLLAAILVGLAGLILLAMQLRPWPPDRVRTEAAAGKSWWVSRRSVERRTATVAHESGVHQARSRVRGSSDRWRLRL